MSKETKDDIRPCDGESLVPSDGYSVAEWSPDADHACGPTQVHFMLSLDSVVEGATLVLRLKSRSATQELIDVLTKHRDAVWPLN